MDYCSKINRNLSYGPRHFDPCCAVDPGSRGVGSKGHEGTTTQRRHCCTRRERPSTRKRPTESCSRTYDNAFDSMRARRKPSPWLLPERRRDSTENEGARYLPKLHRSVAWTRLQTTCSSIAGEATGPRNLVLCSYSPPKLLHPSRRC